MESRHSGFLLVFIVFSVSSLMYSVSKYGPMETQNTDPQCPIRTEYATYNPQYGPMET